MAKLQLLHSITHDGLEFGRGVYEIGDKISKELADFFITEFPWAARIFKADEITKPGTVAVAADAPLGTKAPKAVKKDPKVEPVGEDAQSELEG